MINAFNGDNFLADDVAALIKRHRVQTVLELGTFEGSTTAYLATVAPQVVTIEIRSDFFKRGEHLNVLKNVKRVLGDSAIFIRDHLQELKAPHLIFIDSHWGEWPIQRELEAIAGHRVKPILVVHDFRVDGLGFDSYDGKDLDWNLVEPGIVKIYGKDGFKKWTNTPERCAGSRRGVLFVEAI